VRVEKIEDITAILGGGIRSSPGEAIDGHVAHAGRGPDRNEVGGWPA